MANPNKQLFGLRGEVLHKSFPSQKEMESLPKIIKNGNEVPDLDKLEVETVGNVILNACTGYVSKLKKDGFYINTIANSIITYKEGEEIEFKKPILEFLEEVLIEATVHETETKGDDGKMKKEIKGFYSAWMIAKVFEELGITED
jgi:hypothetical protein